MPRFPTCFVKLAKKDEEGLKRLQYRVDRDCFLGLETGAPLLGLAKSTYYTIMEKKTNVIFELLWIVQATRIVYIILPSQSQNVLSCTTSCDMAARSRT